MTPRNLTLFVPAPQLSGPGVLAKIAAIQGVLDVTVQPRTHSAFVRCNVADLDLARLRRVLGLATHSGSRQEAVPAAAARVRGRRTSGTFAPPHAPPPRGRLPTLQSARRSS